MIEERGRRERVDGWRWGAEPGGDEERDETSKKRMRSHHRDGRRDFVKLM